MEEWKEYILGQLVELKNGVAFKSSEFVEHGVPVIKIKNVKPNRILLEDLSYVSQESSLNKKCFDVLPSDILITMTGNRKDGGPDSWVGKVALFNFTGKFLLNQRVSAIRVKDNSLVDHVFLSYLLSGWDTQLYFVNHSNSSGGQANISPDIVYNYAVSLPPLTVQYKISSILKSLDDKIENNRRINENLEQQAQALFKSWFVDFEPFKDGEFVESELGMIPKDWRVEILGDVCKCILGGTPSRNKEEYWNGNIAWINSGEVNEFRIVKPSECITEEGLKHSATKLLPKKTTVLAITGATLGQVSLLEIDSCANQSVIGVLESDNIPYEFIYPLINVKITELCSHMTGGAQQHINKNNVEQLNIVLPAENVMTEYKEKTKSIYSQITNCCFESRRLAELRDTLLPRLMSGELKVDEINL